MEQTEANYYNMGLEAGIQPIIKGSDINERIKNLPALISEEESRALLGEWLRYNLGCTWSLISGGMELLEFQELIINGWFNKDYSLMVAGRGVGKTFLLSVFCILYAIFNPGTKIVIVANNFRRVKDIFENIEQFLSSKKATLLKQCFPTDMNKSPDQRLLKCANGSRIKGLPLGQGENLRGERANVLIIDEGLLISEHIQTTILRPFLTANSDVQERMKVKKEEDAAIAAGLLDEKERTRFGKNKMIVTSSASFQFEYLYEGIFLKYVKFITEERKPDEDESLNSTDSDPSYFIAQVSYKAVPPNTILDPSVIKAAKEANPDDPNFLREYCAQFVDTSDGYFNVKKLHECTFPDGTSPTVQVQGSKHEKYMLVIDPAFGEHKSNDFFAMGIYMINIMEKKITQVHSYGKAGADLKEHFEYFAYLVTHFDLEIIGIDASGKQFITFFNESQLAIKMGLNIKFVDVDLEEEGYEYVKSLRTFKNQLNKHDKRIAYAQPFSNIINRRMNESLQSAILAKQVWFASRISGHETIYESVKENFELPFEFLDNNKNPYELVNFLEDQDDWIEGTKRQLGLIEQKATDGGNYKYDIPTHMKKAKNDKRPRRDNYTCLLMANYIVKHYFEMMATEDTPVFQGCIPRFF